MNYKELAQFIVKNVGGKENISSLTHCATRLRFNLVDDKKASLDTLKNKTGIMGVVNKGGQYQIIIGSDVASVYKPITDIIGLIDENKKQEEAKKGWFNKFVDTISGIFTPILPPLTASGMIKAVLALLVAFKVVSTDSDTYQILSFIGDATFYFLPVILANSAAKKFKCNPYLAMMIGGILIHPNFVSMVSTAKADGTSISFFNVPVTLASYSSSVIPIILIVWFMSYIEPIADRVSPKAIKFFMKPLITTLIVGFVGLTILGPIGTIIGNLIANIVTGIDSYCSWIVPTLIGCLNPLLVMTGTHYALVSLGVTNRAMFGYDTMSNPGMLASNVAQGASSLAVSFKTKNSEIKQLALSSGITGVCGITEPALYGVNLRFKTPLYSSMIGGAVGGLFFGLFKVRTYAGGSPGILVLPGYIGDEGFSNITYAVIGVIISMVISFIVCFIIYKDPKIEDNNENKKLESEISNENKGIKLNTIFSPLKGKVISLKEVNDPTFSEEILGKGVAIIPTEGKLVSPIDGVVVNIFETLHAIAIKSDTGVEILIHIGLDTVNLKGKYFKSYVKNNEKVKLGQQLIDFDINKIKEEGYDIVTPVIINNTSDFEDIIGISNTEIETGKSLIKLIK